MLPPGRTRLQRLCRWLESRRHPLPLILLAGVLTLPSLWGGVQTDDLLIRAAVRGIQPVPGTRRGPWDAFTFLDGSPASTRRLMEAGWLPFWTDLRCRAAFFRPLSALTHILDYRLWDRWPALMHAQSLAWLALLIAAVAALYRRLLGRAHAPWVAVLAALLFAVDDARAVPVGWLANRNALVAGLFGTLALLAHDRWRHDGWRPGAALAPLALLAGLLAKEAAVSTWAYLAAYALFLDPGSRRRRLLSLVPSLLVTAGWYAAYRALDFGIAHSGMYVDPGRDPLRFLQRAGESAPLLLLGQWGLPDAMVSNFWSLGALRVHWAWAVVFLAAVGWVLAVRLRSSRLARFWALGMVLSVLPGCAAFPSDRLLTFVGLGAAPLLAMFLASVAESTSQSPSRVARAAAAVLVAIHLVLAPLLLPLKSLTFRFIGGAMAGQFATLPRDEALRGQTVVFGASLPSVADYLWRIPRWERGEPLPRRTLQLNASASAATLTRTDARTLVVRPRQGYLCPPRGVPGQEHREPVLSGRPLHRLFDLLLRPAHRPLKLGQAVRLPDATVTVTALTDDGRPAEVTFRFAERLEAPCYRWLRLSARGFVPFRPPAVGETVRVPAPPH